MKAQTQNTCGGRTGRLGAGLKNVASAILADAELWLPARRNRVGRGEITLTSQRFARRAVFPGGKLPPATAGREACRHIIRPALNLGANIAALIAALIAGLLAAGAGSATAASSVNFITNPGFEVVTNLPTAPQPWTALPWSFFEGVGGVVTNPLVDARNTSSNVFWNTGGARHVVSQNNMFLIMDTTGKIVYHVKFQIYVPTNPPAAYSFAGVRTFSWDPTANNGAGGGNGAPFIGISEGDTNGDNAIPPGDWVTFQYNWTNATSSMFCIEYVDFRQYCFNNAQGNVPGAAQVIPPADCYFDNCEFSSTNYHTIDGYVKNPAGQGAAGVVVTLNKFVNVTWTNQPVLWTNIATASTDGSGHYVFAGAWVPEGSSNYVVSASLPFYTVGTNTLAVVTPAGATAPDITVTNTLTCNFNGAPAISFLSGSSNTIYWLVYKNALTDPAWTSLSNATAGKSSLLTLTDTNTPLPPRRFYRIVTQ